MAETAIFDPSAKYAFVWAATSVKQSYVIISFTYHLYTGPIQYFTLSKQLQAIELQLNYCYLDETAIFDPLAKYAFVWGATSVKQSYVIMG